MTKKFADIAANFPKRCEIGFAKSENNGEVYERPKRATLVLSVSAPGWGFGEFAFIQDENGKLFLDTEHSNVDTVIEAVTDWIKNAITDHEQDPEKHKLYNKTTGRSCGEHCKICHE